MKQGSRILLLALALLAPLAAVANSGIDRYLVSHWVFTEGTRTSKSGQSLIASGVGANQTDSLSAAGLDVGSGRLFQCPIINTSTEPQLGKTVTIWFRFRLDSAPVGTSFLTGLTDKTGAGDWKNMVLALMYGVDKGQRGLAPYMVDANGKGYGIGAARFIPIPEGQFVNAAVTYDAHTGELSLVVDGTAVSVRGKAGVDLAAFTNYSIGRLKQSGGVGLTVAEVRIYSIALSAEWIAQIEPVAAR